MRTENYFPKIRYQSTIDLFKQCPEPVIDAIFNAGATNSYGKNKLIFSQSKDHIYILLSGMVKICKESKNNKTMIKEVIYPGQFFNECAIFDNKTNDECAICIHPESLVLSIAISKFKILCNQHPEIINLLLHELGKKLIKKEEKLASFHFNDAKRRVMLFIKNTALQVGTKVGFETLIKHSFTQQDIASITGTSRQTVTAVFNDLKKQNIIHFDRKRILIRDMSQL